VSGDPVQLWDAPSPVDLGETPAAFLERLRRATLLRVPGRDRSRVRAFSTLLHGNEPSGLRALHRWLSLGATPAVDLLCFVGAVEAAHAEPGFAHRMLPGGRDLNRCFTAPFEGPEGRVAEAVLAHLRAAGCEALVDVHNNTGHNPPYAVASRTDPERLALASSFAERFVDCDLRLGTVIEATEDYFPGITLECGRAGDPAADEEAWRILVRFAEAEELPRKAEGPLTVLHEPVRVSLRAGCSVAFDTSPQAIADLTVADDIDRHNFETVPPGTRVGWLGQPGEWPLEARGAHGHDVSRELFTERDGCLVTQRELVPMMMTTDPVIARLDCLFYVVRPRDVDDLRGW
jgi:hypothetical protein